MYADVKWVTVNECMLRGERIVCYSYEPRDISTYADDDLAAKLRELAERRAAEWTETEKVRFAAVLKESSREKAERAAADERERKAAEQRKTEREAALYNWVLQNMPEYTAAVTLGILSPAGAESVIAKTVRTAIETAIPNKVYRDKDDIISDDDEEVEEIAIPSQYVIAVADMLKKLQAIDGVKIVDWAPEKLTGSDDDGEKVLWTLWIKAEHTETGVSRCYRVVVA